MSLTLQVELNVTPQAQREEIEPSAKPVCSNCRSSEVMFSATAYWDAAKRRFVPHVMTNLMYCIDCEQQHSPDWVSA